MQKNQRLSPQDWDQWARSAPTESWVASIRDTIQETKDRWAAGHFRGETVEQTVRLTEQALVGVEMLQQVIDNIGELRIVSQLSEGMENA